MRKIKWKTSKKEKEKKNKGNVWGVVFTNMFPFFLRISVLLFQLHTGNRSNVCQRLTLHRERQTDRKREREKKGKGIKEDRADKHKSDFLKRGSLKVKRNLYKATEDHRRRRGDQGAGAGGKGYKQRRQKPGLFPLTACRINYACLHKEKLRHGCVAV